MYYFNNDYNAMCHPTVMQRIQEISQQHFPGYSTDACCDNAASMIRKLCAREDLAVHFLVGGTQTNLTVIAASLRPHQAVIGADTAHVQVHETGAIEATGHKVIAIATEDGKLNAQQVERLVLLHRNDSDAEHIAQPKMVYISNSTELGTIYTREELYALSDVCKRLGLLLFMDGARLGYALTAKGNDLTLKDIASCCDVFYIGGTKVGAMFGEAVVISNPMIAEDFRYLIKQRGGMLAKGWLLGAQFEALLADDLYFRISQHANTQAERIRNALAKMECRMLMDNTTNQIFPILHDDVLNILSERFTFAEMGRIDDNHRAVRFCTSWDSDPETVTLLCDALLAASGK